MTVVPLALRTLLLVCLGQAQTSPTLPAAGYRVGPGDVLEVTVAGRPDLARIPTVQTTGLIWIPHAPEGVRVVGLTALEIGTALTELLARQDPARPDVTVTVKEYRSQFVWVAGEVNLPGRKALKGRLRLLDALLEAGGFTARASGEVLVQRQEGTFEDGTAVRRLRFPRTGPTPSGIAELETVLNRGDVVTAAIARYVTVTGQVLHPGRYALEGEATVTSVLSSAGGLTRFGDRRLSVHRRDPTSGQVQVLRANLEAIEKGREPDLVLLPDDRIEVKARLL
jgi:polysaccharide export outer membrane protein